MLYGALSEVLKNMELDHACYLFVIIDAFDYKLVGLSFYIQGLLLGLVMSLRELYPL